MPPLRPPPAPNVSRPRLPAPGPGDPLPGYSDVVLFKAVSRKGSAGCGGLPLRGGDAANLVISLFVAPGPVEPLPGGGRASGGPLHAFGLPNGLLVEALGLLVFFSLPRLGRPARMAIDLAQERAEQVYRDRQDHGGVVLGGDFVQGLEETELQRRGALQAVRRLPQALRRLVLTLGAYDLRPPLSLALGLPGHGPLHLLRYLHVLDLDGAHLYAPGVGLLVDYGLQLLVYGLPVGEEVVQVLLA